MLRRMVLGAVVLGGVMAALFAVPASATPVVDQQQPVLDTGAGFTETFGDTFANLSATLSQMGSRGSRRS